MNNTNTQREIYGSATRATLVHIQRWLDTQPMQHLGVLLVQAGNWMRDRDPKQAYMGQVFHAQVLHAMRPENDAIRSEKPTGIPAID